MNSIERKNRQLAKYESYASYTGVPMQLASEELSGLFGNSVLAEFSHIIEMYKIYEFGSEFTVEGTGGDYIGSDLSFKQVYSLINKEARFMFARTPDIDVSVQYDRKSPDRKAEAMKNITILQNLLANVFKANSLSRKLLQACKDCLIGKRVAYFVNFDEESGKITITFVPSLGFVYETMDDDIEELSKLVVFYGLNDVNDKKEQRIYKKKMWMEGGICLVTEAIYDGTGNVVEGDEEDIIKTKFTYIPGGVICNDGLTGDLQGESEVTLLCDMESWYNKMSNADIDAERKNMNPVVYALDLDPSTTAGLTRAPGSFWDVTSDQNMDENGTGGKLGILESDMKYSEPLSRTLDRIRSTMYEQVEMPDITIKSMQGVVSSGKTLAAIYWSLMVRCDEKFLAWQGALERMARSIIEGAVLYPSTAKRYIKEKIPAIEFEITVVNNYPIPDDNESEKESDLAEVQQGVMSRKRYMQKWNKLSDDEVDEELQQIAYERQMTEDSYVATEDVLKSKAKGKEEDEAQDDIKK